MHHLLSIDIWLRTELSAFKVEDYPNKHVIERFLTSATLVDFPQFCDIHHLIPLVLDSRAKYTVKDYDAQTEDTGNWEIYLKYRQILSEFLTDRARSALYVDQDRYARFAKYLVLFLSDHLE